MNLYLIKLSYCGPLTQAIVPVISARVAVEEAVKNQVLCCSVYNDFSSLKYLLFYSEPLVNRQPGLIVPDYVPTM